MGLAGRKEKQRIGLDPRNLTWSDDKSRFSYQHMKNLGWSDSQGIGRDLDGNPNHIAVVKRMDNSGIGAGKKDEGSDVRGQSFEEVLRRLTGSASASPAPEAPAPAPVVEEVAVTEVKVVGRVASRNKHRASKKMIASSPAALAEILGVPVGSITPSSTPASPSPLASPAPATPPIEQPTEKKEENNTDISTSTLSVADYFRAKMRERAMRLANPTPPAEVVAATTEVVEVETPEPPSGIASGSSTPLSGEASMSKEEARAAKKARKEAKAKRKAEALEEVVAEVPSAAVSTDTSAAPTPVSEAGLSKEEAKAAKRARKQEKEAKRVTKRLKKAAKGE